MKRRTFITGILGSAGAYGVSRVPLGHQLMDSAKSGLERTIARHTDPNRTKTRFEKVQPRAVYHEAQDLASKLLQTIQDPSIEYRRLFDEYAQHINTAASLAGKSTSDTERLTYNSLETIALMFQAQLLAEKAGNNIVKGEDIKIAGLPTIKASSRPMYRFYNHFKALENYEKVMQIHEETEKTGHRFPTNVGYRMGDFGKIASRNYVNQKMFDTISKILELDLPEKYLEPLKRRSYELSPAALGSK